MSAGLAFTSYSLYSRRNIYLKVSATSICICNYA